LRILPFFNLFIFAQHHHPPELIMDGRAENLTGLLPRSAAAARRGH
jgi:hypothetical protein